MDYRLEYNMEELLPVVKRLTEEYTGKESSSVTYETAEQLMGAVLYCIHEYEENVTENTVYCAGNRVSAMEAHQAGYKIAYDKVVRAKKIYEDVVTDFKAYGNRALHDTVIEGMPSFFLYYDIKFAPQNHILTLDYPILMPMDGHSGVDAIERYLECILLEQLFLAGFSEETVRRTAESYHDDYGELIVNMCGLVLRHILDTMITDQDFTVEVSKREKLTDVIEFVDNLLREEQENKIKHMIHLIVSRKYQADSSLYKYLSMYAAEFAAELRYISETTG